MCSDSGFENMYHGREGSVLETMRTFDYNKRIINCDNQNWKWYGLGYRYLCKKWLKSFPSQCTKKCSIEKFVSALLNIRK